jgi:hypothetical protein
VSRYILIGSKNEDGVLSVITTTAVDPSMPQFEDDAQAKQGSLDTAARVHTGYRDMLLLTIASTLEWRSDAVEVKVVARLADTAQNRQEG